MRFVTLLLSIGCGGGGSTSVGDDDDTDATPAGAIGEEEFRDAFGVRVCEIWAECSDQDECDGSLPEYAECDYDADAAAACLEGEFVCNDDFGPGYEFVEQPLVCHDVWTCASTTQTP